MLNIRLIHFISHAALWIGSLLFLDRFGHIFVPGHSVLYWIGFAIIVLLVVAWHDVLNVILRQAAIDTQQTEDSRIKAMRLFYQVAMAITALAVINWAGHIFEPGHTPFFWVFFAITAIGIAGWYDLTQSTVGQRFLTSRWFEGITLTWISILIMLVGLELFIRTDFSRKHVLGVWPTYEVYSEPGIAFDLNAEGYRDIDHSLEAEPGVTRVLLLGDSFTVGQGVSQADYYPAVLRNYAGDKFEFIIAALPGASTGDQVRMLETYGCQFEPDVLIVGLVPNDLENLPNAPVVAEDRKFFASDEVANPDLAYVLDYYINRMTEGFDSRYDYWDWESDLFDPEQPWLGQWEMLVTDLAAQAEKCNIEHRYAFSLPYALDYRQENILTETARKYTIMLDVFRKAGFKTVDLFPAYLETFGERPYRTLWALPNDGHPNAELHHWYAEQIWNVLESNIQ